MKFGYFDDKAKEYVITTPHTPLPWINYLGSNDFFSLISNTCGGYSFYKDAKLLRITRYRYNNIPADSNGKYYYINDDGVIWNPGTMPSATETDTYECRHGLGYSRFCSSKNNLKAELLVFVPSDASCEINCLKLKNNSETEKNISLFSYVEFCLWNAVDDASNFQRNLSIGEVEVQGSTIYHKTEYRERRKHYSFFTVNTQVDNYDTNRDAFLGAGNGNAFPEAVCKKKCSNSIASGWYPIAAHQIELTLLPGEEKEFVFMLGYCENPADDKWEAPGIINKTSAKALIERFNTMEKAMQAFAELKNYWETLLARFAVVSENEHIDRMANIWNQYQCMVTFNMSRSASYYESGTGRGMGFRDSCQDLLGFVHLIPERARERIIDIASTQFPDGSAYHQYQPLTKQGNLDVGSGFNDDPLWLIAGTAAYLKETGDYSILDEMTPFDSNPDNQAPLMEHLRRSFHFTSTHLGPHNLPLIGRADWNDCLNLNCFSTVPDESFQTAGASEGPVAESVFIAGMYVKYGRDYAQICRHAGLTKEADDADAQVEQMIQAVLKSGWDGEWFLRAYDAAGKKVGSHECEEGQIFIEPQGFCVMAGIGVKEGLAEKALESVKNRLDTKYGIVLLQPAYTYYHLELGEISSYPEGYKENAGIFCHNNPWVSIAETVLGHGSRAFEIYKKICPAYLQDISDLHRTEAYVYSQMIAGKDACRFGEAKNSWLTGTAAWTFTNVSQYILGIRPEFDGLCIDPCIPETLSGFTVTRHFRGAVYHIHVDNSAKSQKGIKTLLVNGTPVEGNMIPYQKDVTEYHVSAIM